MNELQTFSNALIGNIRVMMIKGEPYFIGSDVADILGYKNSRDALSKHVDEEDKDTVAIHDGIPGNPNQIVINESGLYSLILKSKKPEAKRFKRWVTSEVIPDIRKHGMYATPQTVDQILDDPENFIKILTAYKEEKEANRKLREENAFKDQQLLEYEPKATYYDSVLSSTTPMTITMIAKDFGWSGKRMNQYLHEKGVQYLMSGETWLLYQKYADKGYTKSETVHYKNSRGDDCTKLQTKWTQKGRLFIYEMMKRDGYLPKIEKEETYGN